MARENVNRKIIEQLSDAGLLEMYNSIPGQRQISRFTERRSMVRRLELSMEERGYKLARTRGQPGVFRIVPIDAASELQGRDALEKKITVLIDYNPRWKGTASYDRFPLYRTGMTMREYAELAVQTGVSWTKALQDIYNDRNHGFISVSE